jgi:hypothetical protein
LIEFGWKVEEKGRLFTQVNQSELLAEFMNLILSPIETQEISKGDAKNAKIRPALVRDDTGAVRKSPDGLATPGPMPALIRDGDNKIGGDSQSGHFNWAAWVFGGVLVLFFMCVIWFKPIAQFNPQQDKLLRVLSAVFVGVISAFFSGNLKLEGKVPVLRDIQIGAIGGFAGFALTILLW